MTTRSAVRTRYVKQIVASLIFLLATVLALRVAYAVGAGDSQHPSDDIAVKKVVSEFSAGWNHHDAHAMCSSLAEDVQWVSWRGELSESRKKVEDDHAALFAGLYSNTHRTDDVKSIRYLSPTIASVDDFWTMTGARMRDGSDWPYRAGYASFVMTKHAGNWIVVLAHTADFNAKAPEGH